MNERLSDLTDQEWLDKVYDKLLVKMKAQCDRVGTRIPYTTDKDDGTTIKEPRGEK